MARQLTALVICALLHPAPVASTQLRTRELEWARDQEEPEAEKKIEYQSPIKRVVQQLQNMKIDLETEAKADEKIYEDMKCWCTGGAASLKLELTYDKSCIRKYTDDIETRSHNEGLYNAQIAQNDKELQAAKDALATALTLREEEAAAYNTQAQDLTQTIINVKNAITVLTKHNTEGASFMQQGSPMLTEMRSVLRDLALKHEELQDHAVRKAHSHSKAVLLQKGTKRAQANNAALEGNTFYRAQNHALMEALDIRGPALEILPVQFAQEALAKNAKNMQANSAFLQMSEYAPGYESYAASSGPIYGILQQMQEDFEEDKKEIDATEEKRKASYAELTEAKNDFVKATESKLDELQAVKASNLKKLQDSKAHLQLCYSEDETDQGAMTNLVTTCDNIDFQWAERSKARGKELTAIAETLKILTTDEAREQLNRGMNFLQVGSKVMNRMKAKSKGVDFQADDLLSAWENHRKGLHHKASIDMGGAMQSSTQSLSNVFGSAPVANDALAAWRPRHESRSYEQPHRQLGLIGHATRLGISMFTKIKVVMDRMIHNLRVQQADEVKFKDECKTEFRENEREIYAATEKKEDKEIAIADLQKEIDGAVEEMKDSEKKTKECLKEQDEASGDREEMNRDYQQTITDEKAIQEILNKALKRLKEYYKEAQGGDGQNLLQTAQTDQQGQPSNFLQTAQKDHQGQPTPKGFRELDKHKMASSVVGLIEQLISDSARKAEVAKADEAQSQQDYEGVIKSSQDEIKAQKARFLENKEIKARAEWEKGNTKRDLELVIEQLSELAKKEADLHSECDFVMKNFDVRQSARNAEIEGIQGAKANLMGGKIVLDAPVD